MSRVVCLDTPIILFSVECALSNELSLLLPEHLLLLSLFDDEPPCSPTDPPQYLSKE